MSAGWLWEMRSAIVAKVRNRNPMEVADDLGHRFWRLLPYGRLSTQNPTLHFPQPRFWIISGFPTIRELEDSCSTLRRQERSNVDIAPTWAAMCATRSFGVPNLLIVSFQLGLEFADDQHAIDAWCLAGCLFILCPRRLVFLFPYQGLEFRA